MKAAIAALALAAIGSCHAAPFCYDGEYRGCRCGEAYGYQLCQAEAYGACACGSTPGLVGGGAGGAAPGSFLAACKSNADCDSGFCGDFPSKGPHCTTSCKADADCPAPSTGCNPKGQCKIAD